MRGAGPWGQSWGTRRRKSNSELTGTRAAGRRAPAKNGGRVGSRSSAYPSGRVFLSPLAPATPRPRGSQRLRPVGSPAFATPSARSGTSPQSPCHRFRSRASDADSVAEEDGGRTLPPLSSPHQRGRGSRRSRCRRAGRRGSPPRLPRPCRRVLRPRRSRRGRRGGRSPRIRRTGACTRLRRAGFRSPVVVRRGQGVQRVARAGVRGFQTAVTRRGPIPRASRGLSQQDHGACDAAEHVIAFVGWSVEP